ncbi:hypothetical protein JCM8202v2_004460 [Rhodotorula sphaerocarpa]
MSSLSAVQEEPEDSLEDLKPIAPPSAEHSRRHSRVHSRNLSVFFPRPGQGPPDLDGPLSGPPALPQSPPPVDIASSPTQGPARNQGAASATRPAQRRGHHHRHSVSLQISPSAIPRTSSPLGLPPSSSAPPDEALFDEGHKSHDTISHTSDPAVQKPPTAALFVAGLQIVLGAFLWVQGQRRESLSTTGLGYLVVFDGIAVHLDSYVARLVGNVGTRQESTLGARPDAKWSLRRPYGLDRLATLSHFAQSVYLLFSAIYISKESIEHVLLLSGSLEHTGGHVHGYAASTSTEAEGLNKHVLALSALPVPTLALSLAATLAFVLAFSARNHRALSESCRVALAPSRRDSKAQVRGSSTALNPFVVALVGMVAFLVVAAFSLFIGFDRFFALLEAVVIFQIARPAAMASGRVLLQAMPVSTTSSGQPQTWLSPEALSVSGCRAAALPHIWLRSDGSSARMPLAAVAAVTLARESSDGQLLKATEEVARHVMRRVPRGCELDLAVEVRRGD